MGEGFPQPRGVLTQKECWLVFEQANGSKQAVVIPHLGEREPERPVFPEGVDCFCFDAVFS